MFKPLLTFFILFLLHASGHCMNQQTEGGSFISEADNCLQGPVVVDPPNLPEHVPVVAAGHYMPEFALPPAEAEVANHSKGEPCEPFFLPEGNGESERSRSQGLSSDGSEAHDTYRSSITCLNSSQKSTRKLNDGAAPRASRSHPQAKLPFSEKHSPPAESPRENADDYSAHNPFGFPFLAEGDGESERSRSQGLNSNGPGSNDSSETPSEAHDILYTPPRSRSAPTSDRRRYVRKEATSRASRSPLEYTLPPNTKASSETTGVDVSDPQEGFACVHCGLTPPLSAKPSPQSEGMLHMETLLHIAASYCAYYPQGEPPEKPISADSYVSPDSLLKKKGFQPDLELSTKEVTVFAHPETREVIIAYKGTSDLSSACASVGSCINWKAENYDRAGEAMPIVGWFRKPYTKIMNSAFLTSFFSWGFYLKSQSFSNFKLPFGSNASLNNNTFLVCMGIFSTAVFLGMFYNFMPKLFFHCFSNSYIALDSIVEKVRQKYGDNITLTGHSLGGIRAQIACAQHGFETFTFCAPGGGYELAIDTIKRHPEKDVKLLPWNDFAKRIHAFSVNGDLIPTLKKGVDVEHQECGIPNNGVSAPHAIETMWEMYLRKMNFRTLKGLLGV